MRFGKEKEIEIFKALANKSALSVGQEYGFDKVYKDNRAIRNAVNQIYNKLKNNQQEYGLSDEVVQMVIDGMAARKHALVGVVNSSPTASEKHEAKDIKELMTNIRDKSFGLINQKLDMISSSKKKLDKMSFKELGVIAGIAFDKSQILKGEATEHIAVAARIQDNISPEDAIAAALAGREGNVERNSNRG